MMRKSIWIGPALLLLSAEAAAGQARTERFDALQHVHVNAPPGLGGEWRALRIAKWSTLAGGMLSAGYGFSSNRAADDKYVEIEQICEDTPARCAGGGTGPYADPALEAMYQDVRSLDRRSRIALIAGQVSLVSSVVLFILDLRADDSPPNVPYDPDRLRLVAGPGLLGLRLGTR